MTGSLDQPLHFQEDSVKSAYVVDLCVGQAMSRHVHDTFC